MNGNRVGTDNKMEAPSEAWCVVMLKYERSLWKSFSRSQPQPAYDLASRHGGALWAIKSPKIQPGKPALPLVSFILNTRDNFLKAKQAWRATWSSSLKRKAQFNNATLWKKICPSYVGKVKRRANYMPQGFCKTPHWPWVGFSCKLYLSK